MKKFLRIAAVLCCCCGVTAFGKDKSKDAMMKKEVMEAKKMVMSPETMAGAKKSMMSKDSMVPGMVAKEMIQQEVMHDKGAMMAVEKSTMTKPSDDKMMLSDEHVSMASEKMVAEPIAMQMLFQELVARHIAAKKMAMMKKSDPKMMMSMAGKEMKDMVMDEKAMMDTKMEMMSNEESAMMMAREELIHSLMLDKDVMAMVEKEAMVQQDPKMAPMMSDEKMKMTTESMMKDKGMMKAMMKETMARKMVDSKEKMMMKGDAKAK